MWRAIRILRTVLWTCERLAKRQPKEWSWGQGAGQYLKTQQIKRIPGGEPEGEEESHLSWLKIEGKCIEVIFPLTVLGTPNLPPCSHWGILESKHIFPATKETHINHLLQPRSLSPININHQPDLQISEGELVSGRTKTWPTNGKSLEEMWNNQKQFWDLNTDKTTTTIIKHEKRTIGN